MKWKDGLQSPPGTGPTDLKTVTKRKSTTVTLGKSRTKTVLRTR